MPKRKTIKDYLEIAKLHGLEWADEELPKNSKAKTAWMCSFGHIFESRYNDIQQGRGCPYCAQNAPITEEQYKILAEKRGFVWQGNKLPCNIHTKTLWECKNKHRWLASYGNIYSGTNCPYCSGKAPKTRKDYVSLAQSKGYKFVGDMPRTTSEKTSWICNNGHLVIASYNKLKYFGCPHCYGNFPKSDKDYHMLARRKNLEWLGKSLPENVLTETLWKCSNQHVFESSYTNVRRGNGCPRCKAFINGQRASKPQITIGHFFDDGQINYQFKNIYIDVALPDKRIAIEYDGWYFHGKTQEKDKERKKMLEQEGWYVLTIKGSCLVPTKEETLTAIKDRKQEIILPDWGIGPCFGG